MQATNKGCEMLVEFKDEQVRVDPDRLGALYYNLGEAGAENAVCRAMETLALRLGELPRLRDSGDLEALGRAARRMVGIAEEIGMTTLARVAGDVENACSYGDATAAAATSARLSRIGDRSLTALCQMHIMPSV